MKKRILFLMCAFLTLAGSAFAQIKVTGTVSDASDGAGIPYASVVVKGTTTGVAADADGKYVISVPNAKSVLVFSAVGYENQEITVGGRAQINVSLATDAAALDEVMVVAYGSATKTSFTGSAGKVSGEKIELVPSTNPLNTLNGTTPGLRLTSAGGQPGADATITVRGIGSINGNTDPLIVMDGMIYSGNLATIPSSDIESITVLKDAASTALYGSRAANGVIMITTKQGKGEVPSINVKISHGFVTREQKDYKTMNLQDYMENYWQQLYNTNVLNGQAADVAATNASGDLLTNLGYREDFYPFTGAAFNNVVGTDGKFNPAAKFLYEDDVDWLGATERVGQVQDYGISASGKGKYTTYFGSVGYTDTKGYMVGTGFERYSARANVSFEKKWLKFGVNASGSVSDQSGNLSTSANDRQNAYHVVLKIVPTYPIHLHWADGSYVLDGAGNKIYDFGEGYNQPDDFKNGLKVYYKPDGISYDVIPARTDFSFNVAAYTANRYSHYKRNIINVKPFIEIKLPFDLKFTANASIYNSGYTAHSATPYFEDYKGHSSSATLTFSNTQTRTANQLLSWTKSFGDHHVDALVGHETYQYVYDYETSGKANQIVIGTNYQFNNYADANTVPSGYQHNYRTESYLGRVNYDYLSKYYLSASFRRDGSSRFYSKSRWGNFWSVGGSWIISNEDFMKGVSQIDQLKLRASIGTVGNDDLGQYWPYMALYELKLNDTEPGYTQVMDSPGNLDLQWEVNTNWDVAVEFQAFKRRLTGTIEYFHHQTSNLLMDVTLAPSTGKNSYPTNDGGLLNSGFELQLGYDIIKTKKVKWNVGANASILKNKITYLPIPAYTTNSSFNKIEEGHSVYEWWLYQWQGVDPATGLNYFTLGDGFYKKDAEGNVTNEYIDGIETNADVVTIDGKYYTTAIAQSKQDYSGSPLPKVFGGITTDLTVGNFTFALNLYYQLGGVGYDRGYSNILQQGIIGDNKPYINRHVDAAKSWKQPGDVTDFAILTTSTKAVGSSSYSENTTATRSTRWFTTTNMLEINNVTLAYALPKSLCNKLQLNSIKVYASADHLFLLNARRGYYTNYSLSNYTSNASFSKPARTITVGINLGL